MLHEPASTGGKDPAASYKSRLGIWMFIFYCMFYAGFVALNLASPKSMELPVIAGMNLATAYGFALIVVALLQALVYDRMCRNQEARMAHLDEEGGDA